MAWLKIEVGTPSKPEVLVIAAALGLDPDIVFSKLFKIWCWADQHTTDGDARGVTPASLDAHLAVSGFCAAMEQVGWLTINPAGALGIVFPNFQRHCSKTAKTRALTAARNAALRKRDAACATSASPREEKEKIGDESPNPSCPEPERPAPGPSAAPDVLLTFPTVGEQKEWHLLPAKLAELSAAFPALDVLAECRKALAWVQQCPDRRKTARGMGRFLFGWLSRAVNSGGGARSTPNPTSETTAERLERTRREQEARRRPAVAEPVPLGDVAANLLDTLGGAAKGRRKAER